MIYLFACDGCKQDIEIDRPMAQSGDPAFCEICTAPLRRVYAYAYHCDELRSREYFHPEKKAMVKDHGSYFCIGSGQWMFSKSDRRKKLKAMGLVEHGPRMV